MKLHPDTSGIELRDTPPWRSGVSLFLYGFFLVVAAIIGGSLSAQVPPVDTWILVYAAGVPLGLAALMFFFMLARPRYVVRFDFAQAMIRGNGQNLAPMSLLSAVEVKHHRGPMSIKLPITYTVQVVLEDGRRIAAGTFSKYEAAVSWCAAVAGSLGLRMLDQPVNPVEAASKVLRPLPTPQLSDLTVGSSLGSAIFSTIAALALAWFSYSLWAILLHNNPRNVLAQVLTPITGVAALYLAYIAIRRMLYPPAHLNRPADAVYRFGYRVCRVGDIAFVAITRVEGDEVPDQYFLSILTADSEEFRLIQVTNEAKSIDWADRIAAFAGCQVLVMY